MDATPDELELQDQVAKVLESQGVLAKIKAQLRAAVFDVIHGSGSNGAGGLQVPQLAQSSVLPSVTIIESLGSDGRVALEIVRNFLECLELEHTLTVFLAESRLDSLSTSGSAWRLPSALCKRVGVSARDDQTPVLMKMLGSEQRDNQAEKETEGRESAPPTRTFRDSKHGGLAHAASATDKTPMKPLTEVVEASRSSSPPHDLPLPPHQHPISTSLAEKLHDKDEEELDASMADEIASGSFEEESLAESASISHGHNEDSYNRPISNSVNTQASQLGGSKTNGEEGNGDDDEVSPSNLSPPPVPAKIPPFKVATRAAEQQQESEDAGDLESAGKDDREEESEEEDEELDDDEAAARLRSLEEKLKEMEAQDDTGVLQKLKVEKQTELEDHAPAADMMLPGKGGHSDADDDYNYGSDFEEEVEEEEDVTSELSDDIASVSVLSDSEDVHAPARVAETDPFENDRVVESEDALNSYDYIEAVEKQ